MINNGKNYYCLMIGHLTKALESVKAWVCKAFYKETNKMKIISSHQKAEFNNSKVKYFRENQFYIKRLLILK
jgi:hypothetical protein